MAPRLPGPQTGRVVLGLSLMSTWLLAFYLYHWDDSYLDQLASYRGTLSSGITDRWQRAQQQTRYNASKIALIIEAEPLPLLVPLILHMIAVVPRDWRFLFIGSERSVFAVSRGLGIQIQRDLGKIDLKVLPAPWTLRTQEDQHRLLTDTRFYDELLPGGAWLLKFSSDSILCSNSPISLNDWLNVSWAGASRPSDDQFSGYGGLSLRRLSTVRRGLQLQSRKNDSQPEDEWFRNALLSLPDERIAFQDKRVFAVENRLHDSPMGYYAPGHGRMLDRKIWKDPKSRKRVLEYCPELSIILDMKAEVQRCRWDDGQGRITA